MNDHLNIKLGNSLINRKIKDNLFIILNSNELK